MDKNRRSMFIGGLSLVVILFALFCPSEAKGAEAPTIIQVDNPHPEPGAQFGFSVDGISDIDGDGVDDFIVGANGADKAYVFSGADQSVIHLIDDPEGLSGHWFGFNVKGMGDINADGVEDFAIGAPANFTYLPVPCSGFEEGPSPCEASSGRVFLFSGNTGDSILRIIHDQIRTGTSVAPLDDINADGGPDIAIGSPNLERSPGYVHAVSGNDGTELWEVWEEGAPLLASLGYFITDIDDLNGDGYGDIVAGAPFATDELHGQAYILSGYDGAVIRIHESPFGVEDGFFGGKVARIGDQNSDGIEDYAIGQPTYTTSGMGYLHIYSGRTGARINSIPSPSSVPGDGFGGSVAKVEDKDGDGLDDFWVSAPAGDVVYLMNKDGDLLYQLDDPSPDPTLESTVFFAWSIAAADLDDDGKMDLIIGDGTFDIIGADPQVNAGTVYLVMGGSFIEPDVFDDGDAETPDTTKVWPTERNDRIELGYIATPLELTHINMSLVYEELNLDHDYDIDFYRIKLPPVFHVLCDGTDRFVITVSTPSATAWTAVPEENRVPVVTLYEPDDYYQFFRWSAVDPILERWATYTDGFIQVTLDHPRGLPVCTDDDEIIFSVESPEGVKVYNLNIKYECENYAFVPMPSFNPQLEYIDIFNFNDLDTTFKTIPFDPLQFADCESIPQLCDDPLDEYVAFEWDASSFEMVFPYTAPASATDDFQVALLNREGDIMGTAVSKQFFTQPPGPVNISQTETRSVNMEEVLNTPAVRGEKILTVENLDKDWYYLRISGPFPTQYSYQLGDYDQDGVGSLSDNCFEAYNPEQADQDQDGRGDVCDSCPLDDVNDGDQDGLCASQGDCDDDDASIYMGASEICDGKDNDCNGLVDDGYIFAGFKSPLRQHMPRVFRLRRSIPVKFVLKDCQGHRIGDPNAQISLYRITETGLSEVPVESAGQANELDFFRYSERRGVHIYHLNTSHLDEGLYSIFVTFGPNKERRSASIYLKRRKCCRRCMQHH
jgi:hypothetical protein